MAIIKKISSAENLDKVSVLINDTADFSRYFRITEMSDTFTGGKNSFLIQGSPELVVDTLVKIEIKDATGETIYVEPGEGIPEYYEGTSKVVAAYVYDDTAYGPCEITILGELKQYEKNGLIYDIPDEWKGRYNVKWKKTINVNPLLSNTTKVRFYRRPKVNITETIIPAYTRTVVTETISGSISGKAIEPTSGSNFRNFKGDTIYELTATGSVFSASMEDEIITVTGLNQGYSTVIKDVVNSKKLLATLPYYETSSQATNTPQYVYDFTEKPFTLIYDKTITLANSNINLSFAKIKITDLEAFTGDPARLKIFAKRKADIGNFTLLEDLKLESNEILQVDDYSGSLEVRTGLFTDSIITDYWIYKDYTGGTPQTATFDNNDLAASVKLEDDGSDNNTKYPLRIFYYSSSLDFIKNTEYQLDFNLLLSSSANLPAKIAVYGSGSAFAQSDEDIGLGTLIDTFEFSGSFRKYDKQQINFKPTSTSSGSIVFAVHQGNWHLADVSLRASQETNFSPNELTVNVSVPTVLNNDTYDFRFELYDINNNYIPVTIEKEFTFTGGTDLESIGGADVNIFSVEPESNFFTFAYDNTYDFNQIFLGAPTLISDPSIQFNINSGSFTGSVTFVSSAFDATGSYIDPSNYPAGAYPGLLTDITDTSATLTVENFTGSVSTIQVKRVAYTASLGTEQDLINIYKIIEGTPGSDGENALRYVIRPLSGSIIKNSTGTLELQLSVLQEDTIIDVESGSVVLATGSANTTIEAGNGISAGPNGVHFNAVFDTTAISGSLIVKAYDTGSLTVLDTITLADVTDGITAGGINTSNGLILKRNPNNSNTYNPATTQVTASFFDTTGTEYTASMLITANYSSTDQMKYTNGITDPNITLDYVQTAAGVVMSNDVYSNTTSTNIKYSFTDPDTGETVTAAETVLIAVDGAQLVVNITNENATLPATFNGFVASSSFIATSGSIEVIHGNEVISYSSPIANNTYSSSITASAGVTGATISSDGAYYYITRLDQDSGSITLEIIYRDNDSIDTTLTKGVNYTKGKAGDTGPGITFRGEWLAGVEYTYDATVPGRRDAVYATGSGYYYAALQTNTDKPPENPPPSQVNTEYWESLGAEDFFVAAKIAIFETSTVKENLYIGTNAEGDSGNISFYGGTTSPTMSMSQSVVGYDQDGIFLGFDGGTAKMSLKNATNYIRWNGTALDISGSISASVGNIGGFTINDAIYSGKTTLDSLTSGIYLGTDGIAAGDSTNYLKWDGSQLRIEGEISASIGNIGGFTIKRSNPTTGSLYSGKTSFSSSVQGIYLGTDGIAFGDQSAFTVDNSGNVVIRSGSLSLGTVTIDDDGAYFRGTISSSEGTIGGWTLSDGALTATKANEGTLELNVGSDTYPSIIAYTTDNDPVVNINPSASFAPTASLDSASFTPSGSGAIDFDRTELSSSTELTFTPGAKFRYLHTYTNNNRYYTTALSANTQLGGRASVSAAGYGSGDILNISIQPSSSAATTYANGNATRREVNYTGTANSNSGILRCTIGWRVRTSNGSTLGEISRQVIAPDVTPVPTPTFEQVCRYSDMTPVNATYAHDGSTYWQVDAYVEEVHSSLTLDDPGQDIDLVKLKWSPPGFLTGVSKVSGARTKTEINSAGIQVVFTESRFTRIHRSDRSTTAGDVGQIQVGGKITASDDIISFYSDRRLKNIKGNIPNPMDKIMMLNGVYYENNDLAVSYGYQKDGIHVGVIAQEVEVVVPDAVSLAPFDRKEGGGSKSGENYLTVQKDKLIPLLIEGMKELKREIEELKKNK